MDESERLIVVAAVAPPEAALAALTLISVACLVAAAMAMAHRGSSGSR